MKRLIPLLMLIAAPAARADVLRDERIDLAIRRAADYLWREQGPDGEWIHEAFEFAHPRGLTALAAYTLRTVGVPASEIRIQRADRVLKDRTDLNSVFTRSFALLFTCTLELKSHQKQLDDDVQFLMIQQQKEGGWGRGLKAGDDPAKHLQDNLHAQLALWALSEAVLVGEEVPHGIWKRAEKIWLDGANADGGWGYPAGEDRRTRPLADSSGAMTASALSALRVLEDQLHGDAELTFNGKLAVKCGKPQPKAEPVRKAIAGGSAWLASRFQVDAIPGLGEPEDGPGASTRLELWNSYYLFSLARAAAASGEKRIGGHDWREEIALHLIKTQEEDGSWGDAPRTCFSMLALAAARTPLLLGKLRTEDHAAAELDPRDAAKLARWYARTVQRPLAWEFVDMQGEASDRSDVPVLLVTGHDPPMLTAAQYAQLADYVQSGGTILAVACCSRTEFTDAVLAELRQALPAWNVGPLAEDHAIWSLGDAVEPGDDLLAISDGCRSAVFLMTNGACCAWQQEAWSSHPRHFKLAGNLLRYATHGRPVGSAPAVRLPAPPESKPLRTITTARLEHGGDWRCDAFFERALSSMLEPTLGLSVRESALPPTSANDEPVNVLLATGHRFLPPDEGVLERTRRHVAGGGTLFAWSCCGDAAFDAPFRQWAGQILPDSRWEPVPPEDPLLTGSLGDSFATTLHRVGLKPSANGSAAVRIDWPILHGIRQGGRWIVLHSSSDVGCAVVGHACHGCVGYERQDAATITGNVLLHSLNASPRTQPKANHHGGRGAP